MITFEEAFKIVMESVFETKTETIPFTDSCDRILDEDIRSDIDMPSFNRSAVDGYACQRIDINNELEVIEVIPAGKKPMQIVRKKSVIQNNDRSNSPPMVVMSYLWSRNQKISVTVKSDSPELI